MGTNARDVGDFSHAVSAELRAAIARANYTVRAFAREHALPLSTLHKTLRAERVVDVEDLAQICQALGIDPSDIVERAEIELARRGGGIVISDARFNNRGVEEPGSGIGADTRLTFTEDRFTEAEELERAASTHEDDGEPGPA